MLNQLNILYEADVIHLNIFTTFCDNICVGSVDCRLKYFIFFPSSSSWRSSTAQLESKKNTINTHHQITYWITNASTKCPYPSFASVAMINWLTCVLVVATPKIQIIKQWTSEKKDTHTHKYAHSWQWFISDYHINHWVLCIM